MLPINQLFLSLCLNFYLLKMNLAAPMEEIPDQTMFEDPIQKFIREHPDQYLPPWPGHNPVLPTAELQSGLEQVKEDLATRIAELKEDGQKLRTSIEDSNGATQNQINVLKLQVFQKIHAMQNQVYKLGLTVTAGDCQDLYKLGYNATGIYYLQKFGRQVHCDMEVEGGGWLVIQRREKVQPQIDFNQAWHVYKKGFGDIESEFWIGNEFLHVLTNQKAYRLVVDMEDFEKGRYTASYSSFRVGNEASLFSLDLGDFSGNTTDAFQYHHNQPFTARDKDNDQYESGNCAEHFTGAWWYEGCYEAHLNGVFPDPPDRMNAKYITWWARENNERVPLVLTSVVMRVKPVQ